MKRSLFVIILGLFSSLFSNTVISQSLSFSIEDQKKDFQILGIKNNADNTEIVMYSENAWTLSDPANGKSFFLEDVNTHQKYQIKNASVSYNKLIPKKSTVQIYFEKLSPQTTIFNLDSEYGTRGRYAYGIKLTGITDNPSNSENSQQNSGNLFERCNPLRGKTIYTASEYNLQTILDSIQSNAIVYVDCQYFNSDVSMKLRNKNNVTIVFNKDASIYCESMYENVFDIDSCQNIEIYNGIYKHIVDEGIKCKGYVFQISDSKNIKLFQCDINGSGAVGVKCFNSKDITISLCHIHENSFAAYSFSENDCSDIKLLSNFLEKNGDSGDEKFSEGENIKSILERKITTEEVNTFTNIIAVHDKILNERLAVGKKLRAMRDSINEFQFKQNFFLPNQFTLNKTGGYSLKFNESYHILLNSTKDAWGERYSDIRNISNSLANNGKVLYGISKNSKVLKSMNYGGDWIEIMNGVPQGVLLSAIYANPYNDSEAFLLTENGIYKTTDAGFTWLMFYSCNYPKQMSIDMINNNLIYVLSNKGISLSVDAGKTWKNISGNLPKILVSSTGRTAEYKPTIPNFIANINNTNLSYLLAYTDKGTYRTSDNGENWVLINKDVIVSTLICNNEIYIAGLKEIHNIEKNLPIIYKSDINGLNWTEIDCKVQDNDFIWGLIKDTKDKGIYVYTNSKKIAYVNENGKMIGLNYGVTKHSNVISKAETTIDNKKVMYALVENNNSTDIDNYGIWKSNDNGVTWEKSLIYKPYTGSPLRGMYVSPYNPNEVWSFDQGSNFITFDGGKSWSNIRDNYNSTNIKYVQYSDFSFDYQNKNIVYFAEGEYGNYFLYRYDKSTGGSTNLRECGDSFVVSKDNNKNIITSKLEISNDGGWTWNSVLDKIKNTIEGKFSYYENFYAHTTIVTPVFYTENKIKVHLRDESDSSISIDVYSDDNGETWYVK